MVLPDALSVRLATIIPAMLALALATGAGPQADEPAGSGAPIAVAKSHRLARGHWMESEAILSRHGRIDVCTRTWSKNEAAGFHGAVVVFLVDEHQHRLYSTRPRSYGVNSRHLPGDTRSDSFHEEVPAAVIARAEGLVIQHLYQPESELLDRLRDAKQASGYLAGILRDGAEIMLLGAAP